MTTHQHPVVVHFSRAGENHHDGGRIDLPVGNTEVLATTIAELLDCPIHKLEPAEPYGDYAATRSRNVVEQQENARPAIAGELPDVSQADVVLLGSPVWNVTPPRIMLTFTEATDFTGKAVAPFTTHAMSGLGTAPREYARSCHGATEVLPGLAVLGEDIEGDDQRCRELAADWLRRIGLLDA